MRARACGSGKQVGGLGEGGSRASNSGGDEGLVEWPWEVHEKKKVRASKERKAGDVGVGVNVEEKVRLDEGAVGGSVREVLHAWRCAVMAGKAAGEGWDEGEEGEWREGDCATAGLAMPVGLGVPDGEAGLKAGDVVNGVGDVANGVGDVANGVGDVANGVGDMADGEAGIHEREGEEDPMEVDGECEEAECVLVPPCIGELCEAVLQEEGVEAHAGVSSSAGSGASGLVATQGASRITALSSIGMERGGTPGAGHKEHL
ncbi:unnamed protein product [Closterium sp. Yama58-4]|nr:unnamed protein product [Closterium sp. Yama58-4]